MTLQSTVMQPEALILDRPIWSALISKHACFAETVGCARAYPGNLARFAATDPSSSDARTDLARLVRQRKGGVTFMQATPVEQPTGTRVTLQARGVQMLLDDPCGIETIHGATPLRATDVDDMLRLVERTEPGPFFQRTIAMGRYFGVRENGLLIAMAGERMALTGFTEISAVCVDPEMRGRGLARGLVGHVAAGILERGERPFLHAYANNQPAISLYRSMGFVLRSRMYIETLEAI